MGFMDSLVSGLTSGLGGGLVSGAFKLAGGLLSSNSASKAQQREYERQKEFSQNGIRWKVEDAKASGIHPIYAIGSNTPTYSPQATTGSDYGLSDAGQAISGAIEARMTAPERARQQRVREENDKADLEHKHLVNQEIRQRMDIASMQYADSLASSIAQRNRSIPPTPSITKPFEYKLTDDQGNVVTTVPSADAMRSMSPEANALHLWNWWTSPRKELGGFSPWQLWKQKQHKRFGAGKYFHPWTSKRDQ